MSPHSPWTSSFLGPSCLMADCQRAKGKPNGIQVHLKPLLASYLLTFHWLKQVIVSNPKSLGREADSDKREGEVKEYLLNNTPISHTYQP